MPSIEVAPEYGYVVLAVVAHEFVLMFGAGLVMSARDKYGVKYPNLYASKAETKEAEKFNCVQRGHQNTLENVPMFLAFALLGGLQHPLACAVGAMLYNFGKALYMYGYSLGDPNKRHLGAVAYVGLCTVMGSTIKLGLSLAGII
mmetsp:Transcript_3461/g.12481  ORF Transcript_3461/g.12481 Transcript_3461/m.12481 type:complete len:145 (+) Transcript_3461:134-568(+)